MRTPCLNPASANDSLRRTLRRQRWAWLALGLVGCSSPPSFPDPEPQVPSTRNLAAWQAVQKAEFARRPTRELCAAVTSEDVALRRRAVTALGRMPFPAVRDLPALELGALGLGTAPERGVTDVLIEALADPEWRVRADAAFALGMRADPAASEALVARLRDPAEHERVRARAVEAASKLTSDAALLGQVVPTLLDALDDASPYVRIEAAVAPHRWPAGVGAQVDERLLAALAREPLADVRWRTLFTLQRRRAEAALEAFLVHARSDEVLERLFAVRGLGRISHPLRSSDANGADDAEPTSAERERRARIADALVEATRDPDDRIAQEALLALRAQPSSAAIAALLAARSHASAHVRAASLDPVPSFVEAFFTDAIAGRPATFELEPELFGVRELNTDPSLAVRAAALRARLRMRFPPAPLQPESWEALELTPGVEPWMQGLDASPELRAANVTALADFLPGAMAVEACAAHVDDEHPLVAGAALTGLGRHLDVPESRALLQRFLQSEDNGLRLAALQALAQAPTADDLRHIELSYLSARGDVASEVRFNALRTVAEIGGERARELLELGLEDPDPFVVSTAEAALGEHFAAEDLDDARGAPAPGVDPELAPLAGSDFPLSQEDLRVAVDTTRGTLVFELFPRETPWHVHNFLTLAAEGYYDGLTFHRVVPDFVIQGGDYRGDGNGGVTATGVSMRHEITPRKYVRGSLGMPRNDDLDSGGSQIFVTHRPTPHLDGRYTIFGELRDGFDVLDAIEIGDRITGVRRLP